MGYRTYSDSDLLARKRAITDSGLATFARTAAINAGLEERKCHEKLSVAEDFRRNRECNDSEAHPESNALSMWFDVTGSMGEVPKELEVYLKDLMGYFLKSNYLPDVAVMFSAVGDSTCDRVPLQVGQFEPGAQELMNFFERVYLEGGGGGQKTESYQNALYYMARHTRVDCWDKRKKKGYVIIFGDELPYEEVSAREIKVLMGGFGPSEDIPLKQIVKEVKERYVVLFIIPLGTSHGKDPAIWRRWRQLLGEEYVLGLEKVSQVCELVGNVVGICEGKISPQGASDNLRNKGVGEEYLRIAQEAFTKLYGINKDVSRKVKAAKNAIAASGTAVEDKSKKKPGKGLKI